MTSKEIHNHILAALAKGTKRAKIASDLKSKAGADHRYTDFEATVAQYAAFEPARKHRILVNVFAVSAMLYAAFSMVSYVISLRQFLDKADNAGIWIVVQPVFALAIFLSGLEARKTLHSGFMVVIITLVVLGAQTFTRDPAGAAAAIGIAVLGSWLRAALFPHLTFTGKPR